MKYTIVPSYYIAVLFNSYSCWSINDINSKMISNRIDDDNSNAENNLYELKGDIKLIFPGTKWCGAGDIAEDYDDLGKEKEADMCCRDHDHCPHTIEGWKTNSHYNLTNSAFYTRLSCTCDDIFYNCLKTAGTNAAKTIGNIYFNALLTQCFREDYPILGCNRRGGWLNGKCLEYSFDTNGEKKYQWFDEKDF